MERRAQQELDAKYAATKKEAKKMKTTPIDTNEEQMKKVRELADIVRNRFLPGLYEHYKGGLYVALHLVAHHDNRLPMVVYISLTYGSVNVRPLVGWPGDEDGFFDEMPIGNSTLTHPRFRYIGPANDTPAKDR